MHAEMLGTCFCHSLVDFLGFSKIDGQAFFVLERTPTKKIFFSRGKKLPAGN